MSASIRIGGEAAEVDDGQWSCANRAVLGLLNALAEEVGTSPSVPDRDEEVCRVAVARYGAAWVKHSDKPNEHVAGRVY